MTTPARTTPPPRSTRARAGRRALAALAALALGLAHLPPAGAADGAARAGRGALPDTVLARVGTSRDVTVAEFERGWRQVQPPARPATFTPEGAREFLDLLIGKELLAEHAARETFVWTADESAQYAGLRDALPLRVVFDSALAATRAALLAEGDTVSGAEHLGIQARERYGRALGLAFDDSALARIAQRFAALPRPSRDSSVFAQLRVLGMVPTLAPGEAELVLARWPGGAITAGELIEAWGRSSPMTRLRPEGAGQVGDLVENTLFERELRRAAEARGLVHRPDIAARLAQQREFFDVEHFVQREVYRDLRADSATLRRFFDGRREQWRLPLRVRLISLTLRDREQAEAMLLTLADEARAESLAARALRGGASYRMDVSEAYDSTLFRRALAAGTGRTLGPDSTAAGWRVSRVTEVLPARLREFHEVRQLVTQAWYGEEGERRMVALLARLRRDTPVTFNERALARLDPARFAP